MYHESYCSYLLSGFLLLGFEKESGYLSEEDNLSNWLSIYIIKKGEKQWVFG